MDHDFAMEWANALESGNYEQAKGALFNGKGYCCLGVACKLLEIEAKILESSSSNTLIYYFDGNSTILSEAVQIALQMNSPRGIIDRIDHEDYEELRKYWPNIRGGSVSLVELNDFDIPFTVIAKLIRKYYKEL